MTQAIDTTVPTAHRTTARARRGRRISRGAQWTLTAIAAAAVAGTAAFTLARPDLGSTRPTPVVGQPATAADLAYANEWARRLEAMTTTGQPATPVVGQPATAADLAYANEWARRLEAMTTTGQPATPVVGQPATAADLAYANEWARRLEAMTETAGEGEGR